MSAEPESFYAIRRADGESVYDEFAWFKTEGPDDWTIGEDTDGYGDPVEYEIVRMVVEPVARRVFPPPCEHQFDEGECVGCGADEAVVAAALASPGATEGEG